MTLLPLPFTVHFDPTNQELLLSGKMRPESAAEITDALRLVQQSLEKYSGVVYVNVKRLTHINMFQPRAPSTRPAPISSSLKLLRPAR